MTEKEQNTYPKWIHHGLIERTASKHKKDVARGITDENEPFSLREVGNALNETADVFSELIQEKEELKEKADAMETVLENIGYTVEYDNKEKRWKIE